MTYICTAARGDNKFKFKEVEKIKEYTLPYNRPFRSKLLSKTLWHCSYEKRYPLIFTTNRSGNQESNAQQINPLNTELNPICQ